MPQRRFSDAFYSSGSGVGGMDVSDPNRLRGIKRRMTSLSDCSPMHCSTMRLCTTSFHESGKPCKYGGKGVAVVTVGLQLSERAYGLITISTSGCAVAKVSSSRAVPIFRDSKRRMYWKALLRSVL